MHKNSLLTVAPVLCLCSLAFLLLGLFASALPGLQEVGRPGVAELAPPVSTSEGPMLVDKSPRWDNSEGCSTESLRGPKRELQLLTIVNCSVMYPILALFPSPSYFLIPYWCSMESFPQQIIYIQFFASKNPTQDK